MKLYRHLSLVLLTFALLCTQYQSAHSQLSVSWTQYTDTVYAYDQASSTKLGSYELKSDCEWFDIMNSPTCSSDIFTISQPPNYSGDLWIGNWSFKSGGWYSGYVTWSAYVTGQARTSCQTHEASVTKRISVYALMKNGLPPITFTPRHVRAELRDRRLRIDLDDPATTQARIELLDETGRRIHRSEEYLPPSPSVNMIELPSHVPFVFYIVTTPDWIETGKLVAQ